MRQAKKVSLKFELNVTVEEREGYFAAITKPFAITIYGTTPEEADKRVDEAIEFFLRPHSGTPKELSDYLNRMGVKHVIITEALEKRHPTILWECKRDMQVEAPVCA